MAIRIQQFILESYHSNTYLITKINHDNACYLIDVGNSNAILQALDKNQKIKGIFLTHAHYDHIGGIAEIMNRFPDCLIYCHAYTKEALADCKMNLSFYHETPVAFSGNNVIVITENQSITIFNDVVIEVIATPGHNSGCLSFKLKNNFFTGDALIPGSTIVTKLKSGNKTEALSSIRKLKDKTLPHGVIYPGHGNQIPANEIDWEFYLK